MKKTIFFNKWPFTRRLDTHLLKAWSEERPWLCLVMCHFDNNIENTKDRVLFNQQFVALSFVEFKVLCCYHHYLHCLTVHVLSLQAEISNNIYSNVYLKVNQVCLKVICSSHDVQCCHLSYPLDTCIWKVSHVFQLLSSSAISSRTNSCFSNAPDQKA